MAISVSQAFKDAFKGPVDRTMIKVEVYFSALLGWVDITPWVESLSGTMEEVSSLTGGTNANTLSMTLNNDDGRFSRKNTTGPYYASGLGLVPNRPIRVSAVWGSESVRMFTGNTGPWNTNARARTCSVSAQDPARLLRTREVDEEILMDEANPTQGYYLTRVIERAAWLAGLRWDAVTTKAAAWTSTAHGGTITPTYDAGAVRAVYTQGGVLVMTLDLVDLYLPVTYLRGKALALISDLAAVVDGKVYFDAQGQLVFRARMYRNDSTIPSAETFTVSSLEDVTAQANFEASQFAPLVNKATVRSTPITPWVDEGGGWPEREIIIDRFDRKILAPSEIYPGINDPSFFIDLPEGFMLHRTTSPTYPTAANLVIRSADVDDLTLELNGITVSGTPSFFASSVKLALVNNGPTLEQLASINIVGKLFRAYLGCRGVAENADSQALYGQRAIDPENDFIPDTKACEDLAAWLVEDGREVKDQLTLPIMYGVPWLELNDRVTVSETVTKSVPVAEDFIVKRIPWSWGLGVFAFTLEACTPSPNFSVSSLPPTVTITETANVNMSATVKGGLPPAVIDGAQGLVGLNNLSPFDNILGKVKRVPVSSDTTMAMGLAFDGSDLYVSDWASTTGTRSVHKIDPMTGTRVASKAAPSTGVGIRRLGVAKTPAGATLLFAGLNDYRLLVLDTANFSGAWGTKASLSGLNIIPEGIMAVGGKLFLIGSSFANGLAYLSVWNTVSATQEDTPDVRVALADSPDTPTQMTSDGRFIYVGLLSAEAVARYDPATDTLDKAYIQLDANDQVFGVAHDGQSLWVLLGDGRLLRYRDRPTGAVRDEKVLSVGIYGRLLFDGTYLWVNSLDNLTQISTAGETVASYATPNFSAGEICFDGAAIWSTGNDPTINRVPRIVSGRQF